MARLVLDADTITYLLIAAYARWLQATVVTNNVRDFAALDVTCVTWAD